MFVLIDARRELMPFAPSAHSDDDVRQWVRQVLLPPVSKMIEVTLEPAKSKVKPRENSALRITLRDADGKPVTGTAVLAIYDKSLEAITGGSNVGLIHENFWTWKNNYYPGSGRDSVPDSPGNLLRPKAIGMQSLGRFGDEGFNVRNGMRLGVGKAKGMAGMEVADGAPMAMSAAAAPDRLKRT